MKRVEEEEWVGKRGLTDVGSISYVYTVQCALVFPASVDEPQLPIT